MSTNRARHIRVTACALGAGALLLGGVVGVAAGGTTGPATGVRDVGASLARDPSGPTGQRVESVTPRTRIRLTIGHCWVDPISFAGRRWAPARDDQFGYGDFADGALPPTRTGSGTVAWTDDARTALRYTDDAGWQVVLRPVSDPTTDVVLPCR